MYNFTQQEEVNMAQATTFRPWVYTSLKLIAGVLFLLLLFLLGSYLVGLENRVERVEERPVQIKEVVVTPSPTASPSATVAPVRRVNTPTAVPTN